MNRRYRKCDLLIGIETNYPAEVPEKERIIRLSNMLLLCNMSTLSTTKTRGVTMKIGIKIGSGIACSRLIASIWGILAIFNMGNGETKSTINQKRI
jgi:hypothetical protein